MDIQDYMNYVCGVAEKIIHNNKEKNVRVIDGIGEVLINGVEYQAQITLEPNKNNWTHEDKPTIRKEL